MTGRCKTCKWWNGEERHYRWAMFAPCVRTELRDGRTKTDPDTYAFAEDTESYYAVLHTHFDFGCVQWESADDAPCDTDEPLAMHLT